jgi:hypothetical protein
LGEAAAAAAAAAAATAAVAGAAQVGAPEVAADAARVLSVAEKASSACVQLHVRPLMTSPQLTHLDGVGVGVGCSVASGSVVGAV